MLKLVLGGSGSGKTTLLYSRIRARAEAGRYSILLVPEQFTSCVYCNTKILSKKVLFSTLSPAAVVHLNR